MYLRRHFSSSTLVRLLDDASPQPIDAPRQDVAERLAQWVGIFEADTLYKAHQSLETLSDGKPARGPSAHAVGVAEQLEQVRAVMTRAITANPVSAPSETRGRQPHTPPEPTPDTDVGYAPYRQRYLDQQRSMELMIKPLREHVRQVLSSASPQLRQLAALDAVWAQLLEGRAQKLMGAVPGQLERRFKQLHKAHQHDDPALWRRPGGWLDVFGKELQAVLLAELQTRLEPVVGLVEAISKEIKKYP